MKRYFLVAQFVCACILFLSFLTGFLLNIKNVIEASDGIVILFIGVFVLYLCYLLVREAYKEINKN